MEVLRQFFNRGHWCRWFPSFYTYRTILTPVVSFPPTSFADQMHRPQRAVLEVGRIVASSLGVSNSWAPTSRESYYPTRPLHEGHPNCSSQYSMFKSPVSPSFFRRCPTYLLLEFVDEVPKKALLATRNVYLCSSHIGRVLAMAKLMDPFVDPSDSAVEGWARDELYGRQLLRVADVSGGANGYLLDEPHFDGGA